MSIETYEQIVETQLMDNAISEAEEEYETTGILIEAKDTLALLRRKHFNKKCYNPINKNMSEKTM